MKRLHFKALIVFAIITSFSAQAQMPGPGPGPHGAAPTPGYKGVFFCNQNTINFFQDNLDPSQGILVEPEAIDKKDPSLPIYSAASPIQVHMVAFSQPMGNRSFVLTGKDDSTLKLSIPQQDGYDVTGELTQTYSVIEEQDGHAVVSFKVETIPLECKIMGPVPTGFSTGGK